MSQRQTPFCDEIRQAVNNCGLSRYRICKELGFDQGAFSRFMARKALLREKNLNQLAALLGLHTVTTRNQSKGK